MNYKGCPFCDNATIDGDLTPDTDLSYIHLGNVTAGYNLYFRTGNRRKTVIEVSQWSNEYKRNIIIGEYVPKFCPECGRELIENKDKETE